jgi:protein-L-isoaspartate(D-aspartate) O-methyltransferase
MNIEQARFNMIEQQIRPWNVFDSSVLELLSVVRREAFVPTVYKKLAFSDTEVPLPGAKSEAMLPPKIEARLLQAAAIRNHEEILEIGSGSGYMTALLCYQAKYVTTVEIDPLLKKMAEDNLSSYDITNAEVLLGNGANGWYEGRVKGYDVILISGSLPDLPVAFLKQINVGGRIVLILGKAPAMVAQIITRATEDTYNTTQLFETDIRPLRGIAATSCFRF